MRDQTDQAVYEDEIDLREIFFVLWKRKWIIFVLTFVIVVSAVVYTFTSPEIYEVYVVMEPGVIDVTPNGEYIYLDSVTNIKAKLDSNAYTQRLISSLNLDPFQDRIKLKIDLPNKSNIIKVSVEAESDKIEHGINVLEQLVIELQADYELGVLRKKQEYQEKISKRNNMIKSLLLERKDLGKKISIKENFIKEKYAQIDIQKSSLDIMDQRIADMVQELKDVKKNTDNIITQRENFLKDPAKNPDSGLADLLYSTTIQQNVAFFNTLQNQISDLKIEKEQSKAGLKTLEKEIDDLKLDIERMKIEKDEGIATEIDGIKIEIDELKNRISHVQNIKMISEPSATTFPIKPNKKLNIILSLFIGLILSVFIAFIFEYVSKASKDVKTE